MKPKNLLVILEPETQPKKRNYCMEASPLVGMLVLIFPVIGAIGMIWFMMSGKGKPAPTQDEIIAAKRKKDEEKNQPSK